MLTRENYLYLLSRASSQFTFIKILELPNELEQTFGHDGLMVRLLNCQIVISNYRIHGAHRNELDHKTLIFLAVILTERMVECLNGYMVKLPCC